MIDETRGGKSAPPGLITFNTREKSESVNHIIEDPDYYQYYKMAHNPRLPKPTINPNYASN